MKPTCNSLPSSLSLSLLPLSLPPFLPPSLMLTQYIYARPNQLDVFKGAVIPWCHNCTSQAVQQGLGVVGAVIMPHNLYLHSGLVLVSVASLWSGHMGDHQEHSSVLYALGIG